MQNLHLILFFGLCLLASAGISELFLETYEQTQQTLEDKMVDKRGAFDIFKIPILKVVSNQAWSPFSIDVGTA